MTKTLKKELTHQEVVARRSKEIRVDFLGYSFLLNVFPLIMSYSFIRTSIGIIKYGTEIQVIIGGILLSIIALFCLYYTLTSTIRTIRAVIRFERELESLDLENQRYYIIIADPISAAYQKAMSVDSEIGIVAEAISKEVIASDVIVSVLPEINSSFNWYKLGRFKNVVGLLFLSDKTRSLR
jgi:hypothetical protein